MNAAPQALCHMDWSEEDRWMRDDPRLFERVLWQAGAFPSMVLPGIENPALVMGIVHDFGVGEVWMVTGAAFRGAGTRLWGEILSMQRQLLASSYKALNLHRMHILVDPARSEAQRWAGALGFCFEVPLARFGPRGEDLEFWVWPHTQRERG